MNIDANGLFINQFIYFSIENLLEYNGIKFLSFFLCFIQYFPLSRTKLYLRNRIDIPRDDFIPSSIYSNKNFAIVYIYIYIS